MLASNGAAQGRTAIGSKYISPMLVGAFFEDLNYAADGGLYAELVQNRSFEYAPSDIDLRLNRDNTWHSLTAWQFVRTDNAIGRVTVESASPLNVDSIVATLFGWGDSPTVAVVDCLDASASPHPIGRCGGTVSVDGDITALRIEAQRLRTGVRATDGGIVGCQHMEGVRLMGFYLDIALGKNEPRGLFLPSSGLNAVLECG